MARAVFIDQHGKRFARCRKFKSVGKAMTQYLVQIAFDTRHQTGVCTRVGPHADCGIGTPAPGNVAVSGWSQLFPMINRPSFQPRCQ